MPLYPAPQSFTTGSVPFGGISGLLTQDNPNLFWDDTNNRFGLRTTDLTGVLNILSLGPDATQTLERISNDANGSGQNQRKARGTGKGAESAALSGDITCAVAGQPYNAATSGQPYVSNSGNIRNVLTENASTTAIGARWDIRNTPNGTTTIQTNLVLEGDGRISGRVLHNNPNAVTGTTAQYIASGTYTPTLTNVTNLDGSTSFQAQWMRVGNVVTVSGKINADPTAAGLVQLGISLPIASNLANQEDCSGAAASPGIASQSAAILADAVNDRAEMNWIAVDLTNQSMYYVFAYEIL